MGIADGTFGLVMYAYCEDKSCLKTCKAFRVFIWCNEVGTDLICMTGTNNIHTGPDLLNPDMPLLSTDSLNLTLNARQPSGWRH